MGAARRRAFLAEIKTIKDAIHPTPLALLVRGSQNNRGGGGTDIGLGVRDGLNAMSLADAHLKRYLESAMDAIYPLQSSAGHEAIMRYSYLQNPTYSDVLVMEAVIILLSPDQVFKGPNSSVGAVTWQASCALMKDPAKFITRIRRIDRNAIPEHNFLALQEYLAHPGWPTAAQLASAPLVSDDAVVRGVSVLHRLCIYVNSTVQYYDTLNQEGGYPPEIGRRGGIFASVTTVQDDATEPYGGVGLGWRQAFVNLFSAVLRDVKVYSVGSRIRGTHHVITIYRDRQRMFFESYNPHESKCPPFSRSY